MRKIISLIVAIIMVASFVLTVPAVGVLQTSASVRTPMQFVDGDQAELKVMAPAPPTNGNKWALVIGIADYVGVDSDLWNPDDDAKEMYSELINQQGFAKKNVKLLTNGQATARAISSAIDWLVKSEKAGDKVVFFYSGHGFRAADSEGWDTDTENDGYDEGIVSADMYGLSDGWLKSKFSKIESTAFGLMFGSCHSGGMFDDDDDLQGAGRIIASACKADQYGWDYSLLGNTLWGFFFVDEGLLDNKADSIEAAHAYAAPFVIEEQADSQPQLYDNFVGPYLI